MKRLFLLILLVAQMQVLPVLAEGPNDPASPAATAGGQDAQAAAESATENKKPVSTNSLCSSSMPSFSRSTYKPGKEVQVIERQGLDLEEGEEGTQVQNTYICTKLLEPIPLSTLNPGDVCIYDAFTSGGDMVTALIVKPASPTEYEFKVTNTTAETAKSLQCRAIGVESGLKAVERYIGIFYSWASMIMGVICVLIIIIGGIMVSLEGANPDIKGTGISMIKNALIGLTILFLAGAILRVLNPIFFT